ncbi:hypothetical protein MKAN_22450 [Mycobacterium kansasii ATCC 12478]|uniref:Uncharacterized protein n=1 Tax=Mycobacterium kansasii ATCC 12478 TaxID=557599 RepID=U5X2H5_MYCKA|nr:hypothetical protein MKAN_22450 [Mycobacterium kansasii ATCC 12478]
MLRYAQLVIPMFMTYLQRKIRMEEETHHHSPAAAPSLPIG